ncbi:MAG: glycoside hydrolase family 38 C-terminal domain-containing protein [Eubacteriales bacterium]|nr:glycoside hydrolase family 38 C-terminal domain-containing protein [Eubacteriales bacterium]
MQNRQHQQRLEAWRRELWRHLSTPVATVELMGFTTYASLSPQEAEAQAFRPFFAGEEWGACWEYAWFRGEMELPAVCQGKRVVLFSGVGGEQQVYLDGAAIGSIDREHSYVTLSRCAEAGQRFHLLMESYAGHGARLESLDPCPPERPAIPTAPEFQCKVKESVVSLWNEDAYQLLVDVETLSRLLQVLPERSLRAQKVEKALMTFTELTDFELPPDKRQESFRLARKALEPALACHNGSTAPMLSLLGQSHIDLAWLWTEAETRRKSVRTYSNQLTLMEEYPEYRFLLCEPALLEMLKARDGALWEKVKQAVHRGQILPEGGFYVESDTNIPSGESLIRQLMWGKRWYRENLGVETKVAWHPDTFGFSAALPQLLRGFDIPYFATQKLLRADPETQRFPYQNFIWEGMDGSTVLGLSFFKENASVDPVSFAQRWERDRVQNEDIEELLYPFGYGDGGGGATRDMLEMARRLGDLEGVPRSRYDGLRPFFERMENNLPNNRWVGELYLAWHRGTYTAQRREKALMRKTERALHDAEALLALCDPKERMSREKLLHDCWETVLLAQFHDVAGGVGIQRVHEESTKGLQEALNSLEAMILELRMSIYAMSEANGRYVLCNTLPWERREWVELPDGRLLYATVPASGATTVEMAEAQPADASIVWDRGCLLMKNRFLSLRIDENGCVCDLTDLENGLPLMQPKQRMNDWRLYQNVQTVYDAWELDRDYETYRMEAPFQTTLQLTAQSPALCEATVERRFGQSWAKQKIRVYASSRRVDFVTEIDWQERRKLLKTHFESNLLCEDALHEIQFGYVKRPAHRSHAFAADRYEVCNHRYSALCEENRGFAVLNDGCYGVSSGRGALALSLLRAPLVPDDTCDRGMQRLTYSLYPFASAFAQSGVQRVGYELNAPIAAVEGECRSQSGFYTDNQSVILETVKPAEDGNGVILRLYESMRARVRATVFLPYPADVFACGMAEEEVGQPIAYGEKVELDFAPFQIRTLRVIQR